MAKHDKIKIGKIGQGSNCQEINTNSINLENRDLLDAFTKVAVLTTLAGYKQCDHIFVDAKFSNNVDLRQLSRYLSYVLNHKELAPRKYNLKITDRKNTIEKLDISGENKRYDSILSFSGGIDSTASLLNSLDREQCVQPLWVSFGQRNNDAEAVAVKRILTKLKMKPLIVKMNIERHILEGWKDWNYIIPARNFLFACFANAALKHSIKSKNFIYLCAHKDEMKHYRNTDKSRYFFAKSSEFFSLDSGKEIFVTTPFADISKTEILSYWRKNWVEKYKISPHDTTTCYYEHGCGRCEVCLKRTISLLAAGFEADPFMKIHPMRDPSGFLKNQWIPQIKSGKFTIIKKMDFLIAVEKCLDIVPREIRRLHESLPSRTLSAINDRKEKIESAII